MRRLPLPCAIAMLSVFFTTLGSAQNETMGRGPHAPVGTLIVADPTEGEVREASGVRWGNDVRIFSGAVYHCPVAQRPLAAVADTLGGMYVAVNTVYQDTSSRVMVYRSTTSGQTWSLMKMVYSSTGKPVQAFDMCIADSLDGVFVLTMVLAVQHGASWQGGTLYWLAMHADGTRTRIRTIEPGDDNHVFTTPALCTNGDGQCAGQNLPLRGGDPHESRIHEWTDVRCPYHRLGGALVGSGYGDHWCQDGATAHRGGLQHDA